MAKLLSCPGPHKMGGGWSMPSGVELAEATQLALEYLRLGNYPTAYMTLKEAKAAPSGAWVVVFNRAFLPGQVTVTVDAAGHVLSMETA